MALLVGVGTALYFVIPGYGEMKPDFMLTMMFIGILLFPTFKETFLLQLYGVLSGLFSTFPGGFVPNIIDKLVTGFVFLAVVLALTNFAKNIAVCRLVAIGTLLSGTIFLTCSFIIGGLPGAFGIIFDSCITSCSIEMQ